MQSNYRVAELIVQFMNGATLTQADIQKRYQIGLRTCQRDLSYIRKALAEYDTGQLIEQQGTYHLTHKSEQLNYEIVLAASNILLGTRALTPTELNATLDFLSVNLSPTMQAALHKQLTVPRGSYVPLSKPKALLSRLHEMAICIANNQRLTFTYLSSQPTEPRPLVHHAQPVALFFEVHYFYVAMLSQERGGYWMYRLDRIDTILTKTAGEKLDYAQRFSLQDHRHHTYLVDDGELMQIRFIYRFYPQTALDAFPGSRVIKENADGSVVIEAYVKIGGAIRWLLSQGSGLKVIAPTSLVKQMRQELIAAQAQYLE
ncbi:helix-turn-helix transcriptional regulator [Loigolactobacillus binensis]|uniref:Helix-turn-helix transcriptional regulator n=1 Tax=Loigolactobacillus binensis TaxID=2559922 RepID=A0ABW3EEC2_9LACO|nr:WYL domain-containing protein [Loigolactobacillus binensis]